MQKDVEKILNQAEKIISIDQKTDKLKYDSTELANDLLYRLKKILIIKFDEKIFDLMDTVFNFAVTNNFLHPVDKEDYQKFIIEKRCDLFDMEEGAGNANNNQCTS